MSLSEEQFSELTASIKALQGKLGKFKVSEQLKTKIAKEEMVAKEAKEKAEKLKKVELRRKKYKFDEHELDEFMENVLGDNMESLQEEEYETWYDYDNILYLQNNHPDVVEKIVNMSNEFTANVRKLLEPLVQTKK